MFRWLEMASIILKHANQTFDIFLYYAKKSAICAILKSDMYEKLLGGLKPPSPPPPALRSLLLFAVCTQSEPASEVIKKLNSFELFVM
jgi:hypothetical protein